MSLSPEKIEQRHKANLLETVTDSEEAVA